MVTRNIPVNSPLHRRIMAKLSSFEAMAKGPHASRCVKWSEAEDAVVAYVPETATDAKRRQRRERGEPVYTTLSIPYTYAQVMSAHTYWTSVFFGRTPIHQFAGRHGEGEMQVQALEALIDYQVQVGEMLGPYYMWLYDAGKYGAGIIGEYWDNRVVQYGRVERGANGLMQTSYQVQKYLGNCIYNVSPFNFMHDPRVTLGNFQKGEFVIVKNRISWNDLVRRKSQEYVMNTESLSGQHAPSKSNEPTSSLTLPEDTPLVDLNDEGVKITHPSRVFIYEIYVELIQNEWGLGSSKYPEKWVFTTTQDMTLLLGAEPLGAVHGDYPFDIAEPEVEAYAAYNRGIPEVMKSLADTMDWLVNSHMFNVRATLNNQFIGDPSRIMMKDVNKSGEPGFFFRIRPEAYGQDVRTMLTQLPVQDVTHGHMNDLAQMFSIGERVLGINDQMMGALGGGGSSRKTATEVRTTTGFGVNRLKTISEYLGATAFTKHASKLVQNSQQFYDAPQKLRIVGDTSTLAGPKFWDVTPEMIAGMYDFVPVNGTLPVDRMAQANLWKELMMGFRQLPMLMQKYDLGKIFAYTAQLAGMKNINQMQIQVGSPEALQAAAQAGNMIPVRPGDGNPGVGSPDSATTAGLNAEGAGAY